MGCCLVDGVFRSLISENKTQPYKEGQPKHIVIKSDAKTPPFRYYLFALENAAEIWADGFIDQIKHGGPNTTK